MLKNAVSKVTSPLNLGPLWTLTGCWSWRPTRLVSVCPTWPWPTICSCCSRREPGWNHQFIYKSSPNMYILICNVPQGSGAIFCLSFWIILLPAVRRKQLVPKRPKFLQQPISNSYNGYMVNNNKTWGSKQKWLLILDMDVEGHHTSKVFKLVNFKMLLF